MQNLNVLLRDSVAELGRIGDVVRVAPGYARNYLFPRGLAVEATPENIRLMERSRERIELQLAEQERDVAARLEALGRIQLRTKEKADEGGHLYGSVNAATIVRLLADKGHSIDERAVRLDEPIKTVGAHEVPIHVHGEHYAGIQIVVEPA